ncbi:HemK2/MTQ2 family protein methyltransferase [Natronomonas sp. EA1]|uniref:HemK2/MTQ2 family protein methyltransferase n=1 Tax=Natronomonas sp. EA1 TaxID=3421655 RepID=UPI003EB8A626
MSKLSELRGENTAVYQPAEDSGLLASAARERVGSDDRVLDVGTGSGWVAQRVAETGAEVVASDVNPHACEQARERGVPVVRADLTEPFRTGSFDWVLFNPPYLPLDEEAFRDDWMEVALTGGETGREVIEPFLEGVGRVLAPGGSVLMLVSSLTDIEEVASYADDQGLAAETVTEESHPFERLVVLRLWPA